MSNTMKFLLTRVTTATFFWGVITGSCLVFVMSIAMIWTLR